jgi:hypothetical protein
MDYIRIPWHSIMFHYTFHYTARHYIHIYNYWHKWITSIYKRLKPLWCLYANQLGDFRSQISPFLASIAAETSGAMFLLWTWELWSGWWKSRAHAEPRISRICGTHFWARTYFRIPPLKWNEASQCANGCWIWCCYGKCCTFFFMSFIIPGTGWRKH